MQPVSAVPMREAVEKADAAARQNKISVFNPLQEWRGIFFAEKRLYLNKYNAILDGKYYFTKEEGF